MIASTLVSELRATHRFFNKSTACLQEGDSTFSSAEGAFTVAQQVAHSALTVDWFVEGAFRPEGFDMNFEQHNAHARRVESLEEARRMLADAFSRAIETFGSKSPDELAVPLPDGPVMGGLPRWSVVGAITDHTAHHRGALTVYSRLLGHTPEMPY